MVLSAGTEIPDKPETVTSPRSVKTRRSAVASIGLGFVSTISDSRPARVEPPTIVKSLLGCWQEAAARPRIDEIAESCVELPAITSAPWGACWSAFRFVSEAASPREEEPNTRLPPNSMLETEVSEMLLCSSSPVPSAV